jgi:hypothetical protein
MKNNSSLITQHSSFAAGAMEESSKLNEVIQENLAKLGHSYGKGGQGDG